MSEANCGAREPDERSVRAAIGALALEALFFDDVRADTERVRRDPALLSRPLRVIVPSRSLRDHLASTIVRDVRASVAGVSIETLHGFALSVLQRAGVPPPRGARLFELYVRRGLASEPALAAELASSDAGPTAAAATLADFFDAGFASEHAEALRDSLDDATSRASRRARSLVTVAERCAREMDALDVGRSSSVLARAADVLKRDAARSRETHEFGAARSRAIWIYGFSDATGLALDLLAVLRERFAARVYVDSPAPISIGADARSNDAFGARFRERLNAKPSTANASARVDGAFTAFFAPGAEAEIREVAARVRALLDAGVRPESIGVVARDLEPWRLPLRAQFTRLSIPYSAGATRGAPGIDDRRARGLAELLRRGGELPVERWLELRATVPETPEHAITSAASTHDLALACRALGCVRLATLARFDLERRLGSRTSFLLPLHAAADHEARDDEIDDASARTAGSPDSTRSLVRRAIPRRTLEALRDDARAVHDRLERRPALATLASHVEQLARLVRDDLHWNESTHGFAAYARAVAIVVEDVPATIELTGEDFMRVIERAIADAAESPLGGAGGGVQCLSVVEARARTFEHLFVVGLNQDVFPRSVREDPLLPDALRRRMSSVLPDLPIKSAGRAEERFLFDQLLGAARDVTLSWQTMDDDGKPATESPFLGRLDIPVRSIAMGAPKSAREHAIAAALCGSSVITARANVSELLPLALAEARACAALSPPHPELARVHMAALAELDATPFERLAPGPFFGFVGSAARERDPRHAPLWVTTLERMAICPWQVFLQRVLRIQPAPDPLAALPTVDARIVGIAVHALLAEVADAKRDRGDDLARVLAREPVSVRWPAARELERLLADVAERVLSDEGLALPGLERVLIEKMRPYVEVARARDEAARDSVRGVLGCEVEGSVAVADGAGGSRTLAFRVDRVDRAGDVASGDAGALLTDFKTGRPISLARTSKKRDEHLAGAVAGGIALQAAVYAEAAGAGARGRYVFLKPDVDDALRELSIEHGSAPHASAWAGAAETLASAWRRGSFMPRLVDARLDKEPVECRRCAFASACVRGDSGARARVVAWLRASESALESSEGSRGRSIDAHDSSEARALAVWRLGRDTEAGEEGDSST